MRIIVTRTIKGGQQAALERFWFGQEVSVELVESEIGTDQNFLSAIAVNVPDGEVVVAAEVATSADAAPE